MLNIFWSVETFAIVRVLVILLSLQTQLFLKCHLGDSGGKQWHTRNIVMSSLCHTRVSNAQGTKGVSKPRRYQKNIRSL